MRRILAEASGPIGQQDLFAYKRAVGARPEWAGYDEVLDVSLVDSLLDIRLDNLKAVADFAASLDQPEQPSKFAIVAPQDLYFGLGKSMVFGLFIAQIGCRQGLSAGQGPTAVGVAATRAVVSSLIWIVVIDGLFAALLGQWQST